MSNVLPLSGTRVVDLADEKGEMAGRILGDFGAEVDPRRAAVGGAPIAQPSRPSDGRARVSTSPTRNSNKLGLALDLEAGRAARAPRPARARGRDDRIREPGRLAELGLDPAELSERFPHLIVLSISDFGQTGPYRDWVATDSTMCAIAGMQCKAGTPIASRSSARRDGLRHRRHHGGLCRDGGALPARARPASGRRSISRSSRPSRSRPTGRSRTAR